MMGWIYYFLQQLRFILVEIFRVVPLLQHQNPRLGLIQQVSFLPFTIRQPGKGLYFERRRVRFLIRFTIYYKWFLFSLLFFILSLNSWHKNLAKCIRFFHNHSYIWEKFVILLYKIHVHVGQFTQILQIFQTRGFAFWRHRSHRYT